MGILGFGMSLVGVFGLATVQGAVVFTDDFEAFTVGGPQNFGSGGAPRNYIGNTLDILDETTGTPFGGTENQFLGMRVGSSFLRSDSVSQATTSLVNYNFSLYDSSMAASGADGVFFGIGNGDLNSSKSFASWVINNGALALGDNTTQVSGTLPTLLQDRVYKTFVLYNGTASPASIAGTAGETLAADRTALFFYDTVSSTLIDAGRFSHSAAVTPASFLFRNFSSGDNELYVDDFSLSDDLKVIPEPAAVSLLLLGGLGMCLRRARR